MQHQAQTEKFHSLPPLLQRRASKALTLVSMWSPCLRGSLHNSVEFGDSYKWRLSIRRARLPMPLWN